MAWMTSSRSSARDADDRFEELAVAAWTDHEHLWRISVGVHVDDDQRMVDSVDDLVRGEPCRAADR